MHRSFKQHLDPAFGPKRILALDGGGLRGVLTIGMLREIERALRILHEDSSFRIADYFDLIAGTSTGAIIAAALSLGMSVDEVEAHFLKLGNLVYKPNLLRWGPLRAVRAKYEADDIATSFRSLFGDLTMSSGAFRTGLLVMTKRLDTGSPWPITNNPRAKYFAGRAGSTSANAEYPLWQVVRASVASPSMFDPETIRIGSDPERSLPGVEGDFIDGGVSPNNNPSLQAVMTATMDGYRLQWPAGEDRLLVVSVGAGKANPGVGHANLITGGAAAHAVLSLAALIEDCADQVETVMQWLSDSPTARLIDREIERSQPPLGGQAMFTYLRYNILLSTAWMEQHLGETMSMQQLKALEPMDDANALPELVRLGRVAGAKLVRLEHFQPVFMDRAG